MMKINIYFVNYLLFKWHCATLIFSRLNSCCCVGLCCWVSCSAQSHVILNFTFSVAVNTVILLFGDKTISRVCIHHESLSLLCVLTSNLINPGNVPQPLYFTEHAFHLYCWFYHHHSVLGHTSSLGQESWIVYCSFSITIIL